MRVICRASPGRRTSPTSFSRPPGRDTHRCRRFEAFGAPTRQIDVAAAAGRPGRTTVTGNRASAAPVARGGPPEAEGSGGFFGLRLAAFPGVGHPQVSAVRALQVNTCALVAQ